MADEQIFTPKYPYEYENFRTNMNREEERYMLDVHGGSSIKECVREAFFIAQYTDGHTVSFLFNDVVVRVARDSIPSLIIRDWERASNGYIDREVGPYPDVTLTPEQLASDASIQASNEERWEQQQRKWQEEEERKRLLVEEQLVGRPPITLRDPERWQVFVDKNQDFYGKGVVDFATQWGRLMELRVEQGMDVLEAAKATESEADTFGMSGFSFGAALSMLREMWIYGDQLENYR